MSASLDQLWKLYKENGQKDAKEKLIIHYIEIVKIIAGRLYSTYQSHVDYEDLVSYGVIGLIDAVEKFDLSKNVKFETYANIRIRGAVIDQIRSLDWVPRSKRQKFKQLEEAMDRLMIERGESLSDIEMSKALGISMEELGELLGEMSTLSVVSLEEKISENANFSIKSESIAFNPEASLDEKETSRILAKAIDSLAEREKMIVSLYYYEELTYKEIADVLGVSESRISQLHTKAILKMKHLMEITK